MLLFVGVTGIASADEFFLPPTETIAPPDTSDCAQKTAPPPAIDTSESLAPGQAAPDPVPVPATPVGGTRLGDCGFVLPDAAVPLPGDISARAWLVADLETGQVLGGKDIHGRYRPASTQKLLTMLTIWGNLHDFDQSVVGTQNDADQEGSRVGMGAGGSYTVRQLILGLMMNSGNDCANALARANGGYDKTVAEMNAKAAAIGALDTRASTVSGLDGPGQQTSVYDLALIMRADMQLPHFAELMATQDMMFPGFADKPGFGIASDNKLLLHYPGAVAGKTGFTDDAGNTFVGVAERDGHRLVVTMLGGTQQPRRQWMQAGSLLDWGFSTVGAQLAPVGRLVNAAADSDDRPAGPSAAAVTTDGASTGGAVLTLAPATSAAATDGATEKSTAGVTSLFWVILMAVGLVGIGGSVIIGARRRTGRYRAAAAAAEAPDAETAVNETPTTETPDIEKPDQTPADDVPTERT